jgi:two-component system nitrate/nitrite response regulator NarL
MSRERQVDVALQRDHIRVMIVGDVRLYREGIAASLEHRADLTVVCTGPSADARRRLLECDPHIVVFDMAASRSLESIRDLASASPDVRIVSFAIDDTEHDILACAEAGAAGYVSADGTLDDLVDTIRSVARGELLCSPRIAASLFRALRAQTPETGAERLALTLTAREREIAPLLERGLSNKEIASHLHIEVATVKNHVHNLLEKLQVGSRGEAAARLRASSLSHSRIPSLRLDRGSTSPTSP